jgi:hypothetical protein
LWCAAPSEAFDLGVAAKKLIVVDKLAAAGKARAVYVASDPAVTKGISTDAGAIGLELFFGYEGVTAPAGVTGVKVSTIKPGNLLKEVGKTLGDQPIDLIG